MYDLAASIGVVTALAPQTVTAAVNGVVIDLDGFSSAPSLSPPAPSQAVRLPWG